MTRKTSDRAARLLAITLAAAAAPLAIAQAQAPSQAAAAAPRRFDIPAQPLGSALAAFGRQAGLQVTAEAGAVADLQSQPVAGTLAPEEALRRLLSGTGVSWRFGAEGTVLLTRPPAVSGALTLPEVAVMAGRQRPWSPVAGYNATLAASASKTDTPLLETPQSVSVVTADQMRAQDAISVTDALAYVPGLNAQAPTFSRMADDFTMRGFNIADAYSGMLRDGLRLQPNVYGLAQEPYGMERIEVVRGAASVLYGQLSPGGLINAVSKRPTEETLREINIGYGSDDRRFISGDYAGKLTEDGTLSFRLTGLWREADNWVNHVQDNRRYIAPALTWRPDSSTSLTLLASYQRSETQFAAPMPYAALRSGTVPRDFFAGEPGFDRFDTTAYTAGYLLEHAFNDRVKWRSGARYFTSSGNWDYLTFLSATANGTVNRGLSQREEASTGFTADNSLEMRFSTGAAEHTLLAGIDYFNARYNSHRYLTGTAYPINLFNPAYGRLPIVNRAVDTGSRTNGDQVGVYLQDQIRLGQLVLTLGGRHDWTERKTSSFRSGAQASQSDDAFTGRAGAVYLFENGLAPYLSFSQSFAPNIGTDRLGEAFSPTRGTQYEAGLRYQPPGTSMTFSAAVYELTQQDVLTTDLQNTSFQVQTGEVRARGVELEAKGNWGPFGFVASYAYTDARAVKSNQAAQLGQRLALTPYNTAGLWVDYSTAGLGIPGLKIGSGVRYIGSANIPGFDRDVPDYVLVDAMARYELDRLLPQLPGTALTVNAHNIFGENYFVCAGASNGCRYGAPRTFLASLSYRW
ncbi:TonB-dependent siderophore receptor [Roseomonas sp. 18066]|uniref:TonB-dependent siderophore receptor n=1 Tax=Roseomonas sp. 18066 TaxID=2681412 RepID=UPI0013585A04|nr:TonB-dependent siderophore receptor [Roseomonas sp. 18066]